MNPHDPKNLVHEAYRIDGITEAECRSILIDWALSLPASTDPSDAATALHAAAPIIDHPMTRLLAVARNRADAPRRRGGRAGRLSGTGQERG